MPDSSATSRRDFFRKAALEGVRGLTALASSVLPASVIKATVEADGVRDDREAIDRAARAAWEAQQRPTSTGVAGREGEMGSVVNPENSGDRGP